MTSTNLSEEALAITAKLEAKIEKLSETVNLLQKQQQNTNDIQYPQLNNRIDELISNVTSRQDKLETSHSSINTKLDFLINAFQNHHKKRCQTLSALQKMILSKRK